MINCLKKIKNILFKDLTTDTALRYLPVLDVMKANLLQHGKILEVGSGDSGITPYFEKTVTGLDIKFDGQDNRFLKKIKYNGETFPFQDNEFDLVISVDSLEHILTDKRQNFLNEIFRVAKRAVIVIVPCGIAAYRHDCELADFFFRVHHYYDEFLRDHLNYGLPEIDEMIKMLNYAAQAFDKKIKIKIIQKSFNLRLRKIVMKCKISQNIILNILYYLFLLLLPLRKYLNFGQCYRCLFYTKIY